MKLSVLMITKNAQDVIGEALKSVAGLWDELLVDDAGSTDRTVEIVKKYGGQIFSKNKTGSPIRSGMTEKNLGERKQELVERAKGDWILVLDADERVSEKLYGEILQIRGFDKITLKRYFVKKSKRKIIAYVIPYQNYVFGRPVYWGGEKYRKVRLFRNGYGRVSPEPLHEEVIVKNDKRHYALDPRVRGDDGIGEFRGVIHHYSFRTPWQLIVKFTRYAWMGAKMSEIASSKAPRNDMLRKLFFYGPHMFWARFVKEKGYKDGWRGLILALAFGYMEGLTYWLIFTRPPLALRNSG